MIEPPNARERGTPIRADLVEYLIVAVGDVDGLATVGEALARLVDAGTVRILDLVALVRHADGEVTVSESDAQPGLDHLVAPDDRRQLLSTRDIERASAALKPGSAGVVVVTEDRWAEPLSTAARLAGGRIVAGDRIPPDRIEATLFDHLDDGREP